MCAPASSSPTIAISVVGTPSRRRPTATFSAAPPTSSRTPASSRISSISASPMTTAPDAREDLSAHSAETTAPRHPRRPGLPAARPRLTARYGERMNARLAAGAAALLLIAVLAGCEPRCPAIAPGRAHHPSRHRASTPDGHREPLAHSLARRRRPRRSRCRPTAGRSSRRTSSRSSTGIPLNDAAFGPSGVGDDGTLTCIWAIPAPTPPASYHDDLDA